MNQLLLGAVAMAALATSTLAQDSSVPFYHPVYNTTQYDHLWGSIVTSNEVETTYQLFCAPETLTNYRCGAGVSGEPLIVVEGPETFHIAYTEASKVEITLACDLTGTTAADCSATTSIASGERYGPLSGPLSTTFSATQSSVSDRWGSLTLGTPPLTSIVNGTEISTFFPTTTGGGSVTGSMSLPTNTMTDTSPIVITTTGSGSIGSSSTTATTTISDPTSSASTTPNAAARRAVDSWGGLIAGVVGAALL